MSQPQPQQTPESVQPDSSEVVTIIVEGLGDTPITPLPLAVRERLKREVVDSYAVDGDTIAKVKQLAIHLGRQKADLIREGLDLVLEKYRGQLSELLASEASGGAANPENSPSTT